MNEPMNEPDDIAKRVVVCVEDLIGKKVGLADRFGKLGMDSLDLSELAMSIEDEFNLDLTVPQFEAMQTPATVGEMVSHVRELVQAKEANQVKGSTC